MKKQNNTYINAERWKICKFIKSDGAIEVYENYMASDHGRVCSLVDSNGNKRPTMKILKQHSSDRLGHLSVGLHVNGKQYIRFTHRLIASSFLSEQYFKGAEVDHRDRNPANNILDNLHWVDRNENYVNRDKGSLKQIRVTYLDDNHTEMFDNMVDCSRAFGKGPRWCAILLYKHNGYSKKYNILIEKA